MNEKAGQHIGSGLAWMGFWLMIGLANFGEKPIAPVIEKITEAAETRYVPEIDNDGD